MDAHSGSNRGHSQSFPLRPIYNTTTTTSNSSALPADPVPVENPTPSASQAAQDTNVAASSLASTEAPAGVSPSRSDTSHDYYHTDPDYEANINPAIDSRGPNMSKAPLLIRSSPGFGTGSYGAAPVHPEANDSDSETDTDGEPPNPPSARISTDSYYSRRRHSLDVGHSTAFRASTSSLDRRRKSQSEQIGGSTVVGGLEGRFSISEIPLIDDDLAADAESDGSCVGDGEGSDDANTSSDQDPPDNSPYAQVRASVSPTDNTTLSINTPRMWTLSTLFSILGSSTNLFFSLRYPSVSITPVIALLLVHPLGLLWDYLLKRSDDPPEEFVDGVRINRQTSPGSSTQGGAPQRERSRARRLRLWLAQGSWNEKEHSCVYVSSNVSFGFAFATDIIIEQTQFYKQEVGIVYQLLLTLSTQILGYAFAGVARRFLVRPAGMIWPGTLMSAAMFTTLHKEENKPANGWTISRWKFFFITWISGFLFYFLPGLLMPALSYFNVVTWFAPDNVVVANLFGVVSGLGLFPLTFDWAQIAYIGSPLLTPFWAAMNVVGGLVIVMWIIAPIAYYSNVFYSSYMPILSASVFDNTGKIYDVSKILTPDFLFDREAYSNYSRVFLPITYVLSYGLQFAGLASLLTHTTCWHGKDIYVQWKRSLKEAEEENRPAYQPLQSEVGGTPSNGEHHGIAMSSSTFDNIMSHEDVHNRLMRRYKDAPITWYLLTFVTMIAIGIFLVE